MVTDIMQTKKDLKNDIKNISKEIYESSVQDKDKYYTRELARLNLLLETYTPLALTEDAKAVDIVLKTQDRLVKLLDISGYIPEENTENEKEVVFKFERGVNDES